MIPQLLFKYSFASLLLLMFSLYQFGQNIHLNELCSQNDNVIQDFEEDFPDWLELYNDTDDDVPLTGMYLSDDPDNLLKWKFPSGIIPANGYFLVFASDKDVDVSGELHTNFKLSSSGEYLFLSNSNEILIDSITFPELDADLSYGRIADNNDSWLTFIQPTPLANNQDGVPKYEIEFSHQSGIYYENIFLELSSNSANTEIRYTLDGSDPSIESNLYEAPLLLTNRENDPNIFSLIQSTEEPFQPKNSINKINIIKAQVFTNSINASKIYTKSFIIEPDSQKYKIPIFSIITDPANLFDDTIGIYVPGYLFESDNLANYNQRGNEWERAAHLEMIDTSGVLLWSQGFGIRIHGNGSRRGRQKSFRLLGKSKYGNKKLDYPVFPEKNIDKYEKLVLRKTAVANNTFMSDLLGYQLIRSTNVTSHGARPVVVFINGEFWGLYSLTEKIDDDYLNENFDIDKDSVDLLGPSPSLVTVGENDSYNELLAFIDNNDMQDSIIYNYVASQIDIDNYIDYLLLEFYMANIDWPYNNNYFWKPYSINSKWKWGILDLDFCFTYRVRSSFINYLTQVDVNNSDWATFLGRKLFENASFRNQFSERSEFLMNTLLKKENIIENYVIPIKAQLSSVIQEQIDRYDIDLTYDKWDTLAVDYYLTKFISFRPCNLVNQITDTLKIPIEIDDCELYVFPIDTMMIDTMMIDTMMIDTMMIDTMMIDTMVIDTMMIDTMVIDTMIDPFDGIVEFDCLQFNHSNNNQLILTQYCFTGKYELSLFDLSGRLLKKQVEMGELAFVHYDNLTTGIYIVICKSSDKRIAKKIFVP